MKKVMLLAVASLVASAMAQPVPKPIEITVGGAFWTNDHKDFGFDTGLWVGLDYYVNKFEAPMTTGFVGVRGLLGDGDFGIDDRTFGAHYGVRMGFAREGGVEGPMYAKVAAGIYHTKLENIIDGKGGPPSEQAWDFGGFVALGYQLGGQAALAVEVGYYIMPNVLGVNNVGFLANASIRF